MRIAVANWSSRKAGGTEAYLDEVVSELSAIGNDVAFFHELDVPSDRARIKLPQATPRWCVAQSGDACALAALREWRPDIVYAHKIRDVWLMEQACQGIPCVFFMHDYDGICISGAKTFKFPVTRPCSRTFGWQCLMHYFPHRCGGRSPVTMWQLFRKQSQRLEFIRRCAAVVTHSSHMRDELLRNGFSPEVVHRSSYLVPPTALNIDALAATREECSEGPYPRRTTQRRLLFVGRMDGLKGGLILIKALPSIANALSRQIHLRFAGDGPDRALWERRARRLQAVDSRISIEFNGWLDERAMEDVFIESDLLVVPSLWPEPFGRVGPEAGLRSLPAAAFAVGGIPDWLIDGVNGFLAPGDSPTAEGLAKAAVKCLSDPAVHERLRQGALKVANHFNVSNHIVQLVQVFEDVLRARRFDARLQMGPAQFAL